MDPASLDITIRRGTRFSSSLIFTDSVTGDPIDMSVYEPFTAEVRHSSRTDVIVTITAEVDETDTNQINLSIEPEDTVNLALTRDVPHHWGLMDSQYSLWFKGDANIASSIPEYA